MKKIFLLLLLTGCATKETIQTAALISDFNPNQWEATGKISMQYEECQDECANKLMQGNLSWIHNPQQEIITVSDPLGNEHLRLETLGENVKIFDGNNERIIAIHDLSQELKIALPLDKLANLLITKIENERFIEDGWEVRVRDWQGVNYKFISLRQDTNLLKIVINEIRN